MKRVVLCAVVLVACVPAFGQKMTYEEAKQKFRPPKIPAFWIGAVDDLPGRWAKLSVGKVQEIAKSPGDRPLYLVSYGAAEKVTQPGELQFGRRRTRPRRPTWTRPPGRSRWSISSGPCTGTRSRGSPA